MVFTLFLLTLMSFALWTEATEYVWNGTEWAWTDNKTMESTAATGNFGQKKINYLK